MKNSDEMERERKKDKNLNRRNVSLREFIEFIAFSMKILELSKNIYFPLLSFSLSLSFAFFILNFSPLLSVFLTWVYFFVLFFEIALSVESHLQILQNE